MNIIQAGFLIIYINNAELSIRCFLMIFITCIFGVLTSLVGGIS